MSSIRTQSGGAFDLVLMGYVLHMLRDPLRGLEAVRSVCRGHLLLLETISLPLSLLPAPLARLNMRRGALEWFVFNRRRLVQALTMAGFAVETATPVRDGIGPRARAGRRPLRGRASHAAGLLGRSLAVRARPV